MNSANIGSEMRYHGAFDDLITGVPIDPDVVTFSALAPDGTETNYIYGTDAELEQDSTGRYHVDIILNQAGHWYINFNSSGNGAGGDEYQTLVRNRKSA